MNGWVLVLSIALVGTSASQEAVGSPQCRTIAGCSEELRRLAAANGPYGGMGDAEASVSKKFQSLGPGAIPALLELLKDPSASVRELAGYVVGSMPGLGPKHLPALFRAVENGDGWLPSAIGRIGTPAARDFLLEQLRKNPEQGTQVTIGLENLGASGAPGLAAFFQCGTTCNEDLLHTACSVLDDLGAKAASAVPTLESVAADQKSATAVRSIAIRCLGRLRRVATDAAPTLLQIESSGNPGLRDKAREAILQVGGDGTLKIIRKMLATSTEKEKVLIPIGALRERGHELGPSVKLSLSSQDEAERVAAAYALGRIGYTEAWPELAAALKNQDDPVLAGSAAESLGRLRVPESRVALEDCGVALLVSRGTSCKPPGGVGSDRPVPLPATRFSRHGHRVLDTLRGRTLA